MSENVSLDTCLAQMRVAEDSLANAIQILQMGGAISRLPLFPVADDVAKSKTIMFMVAHYFNFSVQQLCAADRHAQLAWARQVAMTMTREFTNFSSTKIGFVFGNRDHGTVLHAIKVVNDKCSISDTTVREIEVLRNELRKRFQLDGKAGA